MKDEETIASEKEIVEKYKKLGLSKVITLTIFKKDDNFEFSVCNSKSEKYDINHLPFYIDIITKVLCNMAVEFENETGLSCVEIIGSLQKVASDNFKEIIPDNLDAEFEALRKKDKAKRALVQVCSPGKEGNYDN